MEAQHLGLTMEEAEEAMATGVWPENVDAVNAFLRVTTQWRVGGMGAVIGLDYLPLMRVLDAMCPEREKWETVFDQVRVMEDAAVAFFNRKKG